MFIFVALGIPKHWVDLFHPKESPLAKYKLRPPTKVVYSAPFDVESLSARFQLLPGSPRESDFLNAFDTKQRLLISGENGFVFVKQLWNFRTHPDGIFSYLDTWSFPRDSAL